MKVLAFQIYGKFAHFRRFYTTTSPLTFSIPPFTVIRWIIAAILWKEKDSYNEEFSKILLWVEINFDTSNKKMFGLNLTNTKTWWGYIQVKQETLINPKYTIYVADTHFQEYQKLKNLLEKGYFEYTPYLGIAQFLANINYLWEFEAKKENLSNTEIDSIIPIEKTNNWENIELVENQFFEIEKVPYSMDNNRNMLELKEFVFDVNGGKMKLKNFDGYLIEGKKVYLV